MTAPPPAAAVKNSAPIPKRKWLIVAEDKKSSLFYFKGFGIDSQRLEIETVGGQGDPLSVVGKALEKSETARERRTPYAQIWAVFDRDEWELEAYHSAIQQARRAGIRAIWSNEAFELWYVLHYALRVTPMSRQEYKPWLETGDRLGRSYEKNDAEIYHWLKPQQKVAIKHADILSQRYEHFPERENPSTNVQELVRELNEFLRPSSVV